MALSLKLTSFFAASKAAREELVALSTLGANIPLSADASSFFSTARIVRASVADLESLSTSVTLGADDQATVPIGRVAGETEALDQKRGTVTVDARDLASAKISGADLLLTSYGARSASATADLLDLASARIGFIGTLLSRLDGTQADVYAEAHVDNATVRVAELSDNLKSAGEGSDSLSGKLRESDASARVFATGGAIGVVGALGPLISTAAAGSGVLGGLATSFGLVALAADQAFGDIEYKEGQFVAKKGALLSATQQQLVASLNAFNGAYQAALRPASNAVIALAQNVLTFVAPALGSIGPAATASVNALTGAFNTLKSAFTSEQIAIFQSYLASVPGLLGSAATAAGRLALGVFNIFSVPVTSGLAQQLLDYVSDLTGRFLAWTQSAAGQNAIYNFFAQAVPVAQALAIAAGKLAVGLWTLINSDAALSLALQIAGLAGAFGDALPYLRPFFYLISGLLYVFQLLPTPVQSTVLALVLLNSILSLMGLGGILGVVAGIRAIITALPALAGAVASALSWIEFGFAWLFTITLPRLLSSVASFFLARLPAAILAGGAAVAASLLTLVVSWEYILGPAGIIVGILIGIVAFIAGGWVVLLIAAIVSAAAAIGVAIYRNWEEVKAAAYSLVTWFSGLPGWIQGALLISLAGIPILGPLIDALWLALGWFQSGEAESGILSWFSGLPGWAQSALLAALGLGNPLDAFLQAVMAGADWFAAGGPGGILEWFSGLPGWAQGALSSAISSLPVLGPLLDAVSGAVDWFQSGGVEGGFVSWFTSLPGWLVGALSSAISSNPLFGPIVNSATSILDWLRGLWNSFQSMGANIVNGLINGISSGVSRLYHAIVDPIRTAYEAAKSYLSSASPSRRFAWLGATAPQGFARGADENAGLAEAAGRRLAQAAYRGASGIRGGDIAMTPRTSSGSVTRAPGESYAKRRGNRPAPTLNVTLKIGEREFKALVTDAVWENTVNGLRGSALGLMS